VTDVTDTGQHRAQTLDDRVVSLEAHERAALIDRTSIGLLLKIAAGVITLSAAGIVGGAISVYARGVGSYEGQ